MLVSSPPLPRRTPESQGLSSEAIQAFLDDAEANSLELHSFMLLRHDAVVAEGWWKPYQPDVPQVLYSLSKSFTAAAVGFAIAEGRLTLDDQVLSFFPDERPDTVGEHLVAMQVRHLLSMSTGHAQDVTEALFANPGQTCVQGFLACPVQHPPESLFVYNSAATYMAGVIVQKLTGQTLVDYLQPRLFEPLGIEKPAWESCKDGFNVGGWGLCLNTEDIAKFGQLLLQGGVWQGQPILSAEWIELATTQQMLSGTDENDWSQGYGYGFWRCRHGAYRGDGAFGQYCVVMPAQQAVVAITSFVLEMQSVLDLIWKHLLPAMQDAPRAENEAATRALRHRLTEAKLEFPTGQPAPALAQVVSGRRYAFAANKAHLEGVAVEFGADGAQIRLWQNGVEHVLACGDGQPILGTTTFFEALVPPLYLPPQAWQVATGGAWTDERTFTAKLVLYQTPFSPKFVFEFREDDPLNLTIEDWWPEPVRLGSLNTDKSDQQEA